MEKSVKQKIWLNKKMVRLENWLNRKKLVKMEKLVKQNN